MFALIARVLGPLISRVAVRAAAKEIISKYGMKFLTDFVKQVGPQLGQLTKEEIINLARTHAERTGVNILNREVLNRSNAKKISGLLNKGIDKIEDITKNYVERQALGARASQLGIDLEGLDSFSRIMGRPERAQAFIDATLGRLILPVTKGQAFGGGFLRGLTGETLSIAINRLLELIVVLPRAAAHTPKYRTFYRSIIKDIRYLRSIGEIRSAEKLWNAARTAFSLANNPIPGTAEHLLRYNVVGNVAGRLTAAGGATFVFVDQDEREQRINTFYRSILPFAKKRVKIYVQSYIKDDGTRVKGHYRTYMVAA